jgi:hypothetical protein
MPLPEVVFADPHVPSQFPSGTNKHISVNAEGIEHVDLEFVEEPLGVTAEQDHGYLRVEFGDAIVPDKRYKIVRKLGWGMNSSIWMAFDEKYVLGTWQRNIIITKRTAEEYLLSRHVMPSKVNAAYLSIPSSYAGCQQPWLPDSIPPLHLR